MVYTFPVSEATMKRIRAALETGLSPDTLDVADDSAAHAGHDGARGGGGHYSVRVVSRAFVGRTMVQRHRMVYELLAGEMSGAIHALALTTRAPGEP